MAAYLCSWVSSSGTDRWVSSTGGPIFQGGGGGFTNESSNGGVRLYRPGESYRYKKNRITGDSNRPAVDYIHLAVENEKRKESVRTDRKTLFARILDR